jgi:hypothetical protein
VVSESSRNVIAITASVKEVEMGDNDHTSTSLLHHCTPVTLGCEHVFFTTALFYLRVSFCLRWMAKSSNICASLFV